MKHLRFKLVLILSLLIASFGFVFAACGGGTDGTGGRSIAGSVYSRGGGVVANVKVTLLDTGELGITDENGDFELATVKGLSVKADGSEQLQFELLKENEFSDQVTVQVNADSVLVRVVFIVDEARGAVTLTFKEEFNQGEVDRGESAESELPRPNVTASSSGGISSSSTSSGVTATGGEFTAMPFDGKPPTNNNAPIGSTSSSSSTSSGDINTSSGQFSSGTGSSSSGREDGGDGR